MRRHLDVHVLLLSWDVCNHTFCSQQHTGDGSCIFKSDTGYFGWIDYTGLEKIFIHFSAGVKTIIGFSFLYFLNNDTSFDSAIENDLANRFFESTFYNQDTGCFIFIGSPFNFSRPSMARI